MTASHPIDTDALRKLCEAAVSRNGGWVHTSSDIVLSILDELDRLRAAEAAGKAPPREATHAMLQAGYEVLRQIYPPKDNGGWAIGQKLVWESMYDAARAEIGRLTDAGAPATQAPDGKDLRWNYDPSRPTMVQAVQREDAPPPPAAADRGVPGQRVQLEMGDEFDDFISDIIEMARDQRSDGGWELSVSEVIGNAKVGALTDAFRATALKAEDVRREAIEEAASVAEKHTLERPKGAEWGLMEDGERSAFYADQREAERAGKGVAASIRALADRPAQ